MVQNPIMTELQHSLKSIILEFETIETQLILILVRKNELT